MYYLWSAICTGECRTMNWEFRNEKSILPRSWIYNVTSMSTKKMFQRHYIYVVSVMTLKQLKGIRIMLFIICYTIRKKWLQWLQWQPLKYICQMGRPTKSQMAIFPAILTAYSVADIGIFIEIGPTFLYP